MNRKEKDDLLAAHIPGVLQYHQLMLSDGVRNELLYEAIKKHVTSETSFLDVGAGTGVWAILAAKLGAKRVVAIEIEECLIPIIYRHAQENGVANKIEIIHGNSDHVKIRGKFDVIVSELFGNDAMGEGTVNSFVSLRNRFLAPGGVLIPQKLAMYAAPVHFDQSDQQFPANLPIQCDFLKFVKTNYGVTIPVSDKQRVRFLAAPQKMFEIDFRTVESLIAPENFSAVWELNDLRLVNAFAVYNHSTFTEELAMDSFYSQSWGTSVYQFEPFQVDTGTLKFDFVMKAQNNAWTISSPSNPEIKSQNYSPVFAFTRIRMGQKMTPHRRFKTPKDESAKSNGKKQSTTAKQK